MSCTCQNHVSKISLPLLLSDCWESAPVSPSRKVSSFYVSFFNIFCIHLYMHISRHRFILSLFISKFVFLICLQVSRRKHVMRFSLNLAIILTQSSAFLALRHIIWLHRGIPWCRLCKLVCQTPYTWRRNREGEGKESVAINITSLHRLLKMLSLSA